MKQKDKEKGNVITKVGGDDHKGKHIAHRLKKTHTHTCSNKRETEMEKYHKGRKKLTDKVVLCPHCFSPLV